MSETKSILLIPALNPLFFGVALADVLKAWIGREF